MFLRKEHQKTAVCSHGVGCFSLQKACSIPALEAPLTAKPALELMCALPFSSSSEIFLFLLTASEKKSLASRSNVTYHSKVTSWSGSLSSAMRLMPGRPVKDPECRAEVSLEALSRETSQASQNPAVVFPLCCLPLVIKSHDLSVFEGVHVASQVGPCIEKPGLGLALTGNGSIWVTLKYQKQVFLEHLHKNKTKKFILKQGEHVSIFKIN